MQEGYRNKQSSLTCPQPSTLIDTTTITNTNRKDWFAEKKRKGERRSVGNNTINFVHLLTECRFIHEWLNDAIGHGRLHIIVEYTLNVHTDMNTVQLHTTGSILRQ